MGLWLKQGDDLVPVGGGGGGGSFDGEHVLTGDPLNPPAELQVGQLLYDGDPSTGGGGGTFDGEHVPTGDPSDPATLDIVDEGQLLFDGVENDGSDGGPHDHDYLPLEGGTLTGNLQVDGQVSTPVRFAGPAHGVYNVPPYSFAGREDTGVFAGVDQIGISNDGNYKLVCYNTHTLVTTDLQVDGQINFSDRAAGPIVNLYVGSDGSNNYGFGLSTDLVAFWAGGKQVGGFDSVGNLYLDGAVLATRGIAFGIAEGIDTQDVLERAEVATMPAPADDDGVVTADVESLTVNEVMTAMLAKIKELSAEIEELKGA